MMLILYLVLTTVIGLGLYATLLRNQAERSTLPLLGPGVILLGIAGIGILRLLPTDTTETTMRTFVALAMLWIGWIGLTALVTQMLTRRMPDIAPVPALSGAVATLAPVAGFLIARTMT